MSTDKQILLTLGSVFDARALLEAVIIFRQTHSRLLLLRNATEMSVTTHNHETHIFDLLDPEFVQFLSRWENSSNLSLRSPLPTLCLAVQILQHAVRAGYIEMTDSTVVGVDELPFWVGTNVYINTPLSATPTNGESLRDALAFAIRNCNQITVGDDQNLRGIKRALSNGRIQELGHERQRNTPRLLPYTEVKKGKLRETILNWEPNSLGEILASMDHPNLLPSLTHAVAQVVERETYGKDLWLFLPRLVLDVMTGGVASYAEMLYRIFKKNWRA